MIPAIAIVAAALFASVHPAGSVTVTTEPAVEPVAPAAQPPAPAAPPAAAHDFALTRLESEPILAGVATRSDAPPGSIARRASRPEAPAFAFVPLASRRRNVARS